MREFSENWNIIYAYVYQGEEREEYVFKNIAQNIASFIGRWPNLSKKICIDISDYNSSFYYQSRDYVAESFRQKKVIER